MTYSDTRSLRQPIMPATSTKANIYSMIVHTLSNAFNWINATDGYITHHWVKSQWTFNDHSLEFHIKSRQVTYSDSNRPASVQTPKLKVAQNFSSLSQEPVTDKYTIFKNTYPWLLHLYRFTSIKMLLLIQQPFEGPTNNIIYVCHM